MHSYSSGRPSLLAGLGWPRPLSLANLVFAVGCGLLFLGIVASLAFGSAALDLLRWAGLLLMVFWAWPVLLLSVAAFAETEEDVPRSYRAAAILVVIGALAGCVAGMVVPAVVLRAVGGESVLAWEAVVSSGLFMYVPTVFAPILLGHAGLALLAAQASRVAAARDGFRSGAIVLLAVSAVSLALEFLGVLPGWPLAIVGVAAPGYYFIGASARQEARGRASGGLWLGRGGSSPGSSP